MIKNNPKFDNVLKIIDTHDWMTLNFYYRNSTLDIGKRFNEEIDSLKIFDKIITISKDEHYVFSSFLGEKVFHIPPSFPSNHFTNKKPFAEKKYDLIFVGSDNIFNEKSIEWFMSKVYPFLSLDIKICVIGGICRIFEKKENIDLVPHAEALDEYYADSKIALCPMLGGTGIKIKVVEALSYGVPMVGTLKAVDGFSTKIGNGCLVDDDAIKFRENIIRLLQSKEEYNRLKTEAINFFEENFSEEKNKSLWKKALQIKENE